MKKTSLKVHWFSFSIVVIFAASALFGCGGKGVKGVPDQPTFTEHVAPILLKNCAGCHRQNGVGPFPLITYEQVKKKMRTVAKVTKLRIMPPWPADPAYTHFAGEKFLTEAEIETIQRWVLQGAVKGPVDKMPNWKIPTWQSNIGKPDLVLYLDSVRLTPDLRDRFFLMKIAGMIPADTWVRAVEFVAGTQDLLHHFNGHLLLYEPGQKKNVLGGLSSVEITQGEYNEDFKLLKLLNDDGSRPFRRHSVVNYLPGVIGQAYPDGIGTFRLSRQFAFVGNDVHYGPSDRYVTDRSRINVFFTSKPPERELGELMLGTNGVAPIEPPLKIPAGKITRHTTRFTVPKDISILTINPHLHMLGKSFLAYAIKPNGDTIRLIRIHKWDFRWQYFYTFKTMVKVPRGSIIVAEAVFDNTSANPDNPNQPPKDVSERLEYGGSSMRATDEMFQFIITYTLYREGDEKVRLESTN